MILGLVIDYLIEDVGREIALSGIAEDRHDVLPLTQLSSDLPGSENICSGRYADENPFVAGQPPGRLHRVLIADRDDP